MRFTIAHVLLLSGMVMAMPGGGDDDRRPGHPNDGGSHDPTDKFPNDGNPNGGNPNADLPDDDDEHDDGKPHAGRPGHDDPSYGVTILNTFEDSKYAISGILPPPGQCSASLPLTGIPSKNLLYQSSYISRQDTYPTGLHVSSLRPASGKTVLWSNPLYNAGRPGVISAQAPYRTFDLLSLCYSTSAPIPGGYPQFPLKGYVVFRGYDARGKAKGEVKLGFEGGEEMRCVRVGEKALRGVGRVEFEAYGVGDKYAKGIRLKTWLDDVKYTVYKGKW